MLERVFEQASAIQQVLRELKTETRIRFISDADLDEVEALRELLKPFYEVTKFMSGQNYVLASSVILLLISIVHF